jgi:hypothetical protein
MIHTFEGQNHKQRRLHGTVPGFLNKPIVAVAMWLLMGLCSVAVAQSAVNPATIALRSGSLSFTPETFYIASVSDERDKRTSVGHLLTPRTSPDQPIVTHAVDLEGGAEAAIRQFIRQSLPSDKTLSPIIFRIKECIITETPAANGGVDGRVVLTISFDLQREEDTVHLVEYRRGGAHYNRPANTYPQGAVEKAFRKSLISALRYLDTWMNEASEGHIALAKDIQVNFTDYIENVTEDTVFYATDRPLTWNDFRERPRLEHFAASVFPSFGYESHSQMIKGILHINITMKVYVLPEHSWVKAHARDAYSLNHEQRHFDIAKLIAERFKQKIQPDSLSVDNYNSFMQWQYIDSYREMNHLQEQYDEETGHGTNRTAQERWNRYIDEELRSLAQRREALQ